MSTWIKGKMTTKTQNREDVETYVSVFCVLRRKVDGRRKYFHKTYGWIKYMYNKRKEPRPQIKRKPNKFHAITKLRVDDDYNGR